jgi:alkylated DNA repair dioxygenase AlkB
VNYYRNGDDSMGWHRDNEKELDHRFIASLSFGETRTFKIRNRTTKATLNLDLEHGSLLLMENMQIDHEHALPKRRNLNQPRLNLTYRRIRS